MKNKKIILPIIMLLLLIVATIGVTFAAFTFTKQGTVENVIESSTIMLTYTEGKTGIILNEAYPMSDDKGKVLVGENNVFDFTVQATLGTSTVISYEVSAVKLPINDMTPLEDNEVKLYLEKAVDPDTTYQEVLAPSNFLPIENQTEVGTPSGSMILDSGAFFNEGTTIHNYRLRMWVDENARIPSGESRKYGVKVNVYAKQLLNDSFTDETCFTFDSSTGTITGYDDNCPKDVVIPYKINGITVTGIQGGVGGTFNSKQLTSISIPKSVINIGDFAFINNQLPESQAFIYNRKPNGSIDYTSLNSYGGAKRDNVVIPNGVTTIGWGAFADNQLPSVTIPDSVTTIGNYAFVGNQLTSVDIPNSVTIIGYYAFTANKLTNIIIPNNVITVGEAAFYNNQLTNVTIGNSVTTIKNSAFKHNQLTSLTIGNSVTEIGDGAFDSNLLTSVEIPNSVTIIGKAAFSSNRLVTVTMGNGVMRIEASAFWGNQLIEITIPENVEYIGDHAFFKDSYSSSNKNLTKIINKTGRSFNWQSITGSSNAATFVTGTISHSLGNIIVTDN